MIGYAVCIAPITGLMVADYFFVHQRKAKLSSLMNNRQIPTEYLMSFLQLYSTNPPQTPFTTIGKVSTGIPLLFGFSVSVQPFLGSLISLSELRLLSHPCHGSLLSLLSSWFRHLWLRPHCARQNLPLPGIGEVDDDDIFGTSAEKEIKPKKERLSTRRK
ncbi:hypothetical protein AYX14_00415 [Cryptococcus neoformans]|nr:hypothetical protein AYX14_00415 [Cryptococcus neoformans var. grubii]OXG21660.1 hypothetical protein C366_01343 [Cryptococcus neoformans var. grubii Tu401-1]